MAKKFGARQNAKYKVVSSSPSVNKTPRGNAVVPVPYDVQEAYSSSDAVSTDVFFNGDGVFIQNSHSGKVTGDAQGSLGGVASGTVGEKSVPVEFSPSVRVNGRFVVREGDKHQMQGGNTVGTLTCQESGSTSKITDDGQIEGETLPPDLDLESARAAMEPPSMPPLSAPDATKPTASSLSGGLGSRSGSPVILKTAQLIRAERLITLSGKPPLELSHTYLSRDPFRGIFGNHRRFRYEQRFEKEGEGYRLFLSDGRKFDFTPTEQGFIDEGNLGVEVREVTEGIFRLAYFDGTTETYRNAKMVSVEDSNANTLSIIHDAKGTLRQILGSGGTRFEFFYGRDGLVETVTDGTRREWHFRYDRYGNLVESVDPNGGRTTFGYQSFEEEGRFSYLLTEVRDPLEKVTLAASYDNEGRIEGYEEEGLSYAYAYTTPTMITKTETQSGDTTHYGLDEHGLITAIVHPDGSKEKEEYDPKTKTATVTDKGGNVTLKSFDERNRLVKEVDQSGNETLYEYEGKNPRPVKVSAPEGITTFAYDEHHNVTRMEKAGDTFAFAYDERGNLLKSTDAARNETLFAYDDASRLISVTDALGAQTRFEYDRAGRQSAVIDAEGRKATMRYDALDNIVESRDPEGGELRFAYDKAGNLTQIADPSGNSTTYEYDALGNITSQRRSDDSFKRFEYLPGGLVRSILREDGSEVILSYDKAGNPTGIDYAGDTVRFTYDSLGNLTSAQDASGTIEYYYDAHANPVIETQRGIDVNRRFDRATGAQEALSFLSRSVSYERDEKGKLAALRTPAQTIAFSRDASGLLSERSYPNNRKETFAYDETYNLTRIETGELNFEYAHDKSGLITQKNENTFVYDKAGRLTQSPNESFEYDAAGNLLDEKNRYDTLNHRLMENETHTFEYDARGNLSLKRNKQTKETTRYVFDNRNRLIEAVTTDRGNIPVKRFAFSYDALGRRISKTENGTTHRYLYDKANIVAILDDENEVLATIIHDDGTDIPLSITVYDQPEDIEAWNALSEDERFIAELKLQRTYWYHRDHQGSIVALTDKAGTIVESFIYDDAYGKILDHHKTIETFNPYAYTAREYDAPDLYYFRARYYDPNTARFLSEDPIEFLSGDFNFYRYVENNPVNFIDPLGLAKSRCAKLEERVEKMKRTLKKKLTELDALKKLAAKKAAKKVATLPLKAVPILGWAMAAYDVYDTVTTGMDIYDMVKKYNDVAEITETAATNLELCKKQEAESKKKDGSKIKGLKRKKVKCFCPGDHDKGGREEYERQLKHQQDGINNTTVDDYIKRRKDATGTDICDNYNEIGEKVPRNTSVTSKARDRWKTQQTNKLEREFRKNGLKPKAAERMAQAKVNRDVRGGSASPRMDKEGNPVFKKDGTQRMDYQGGQHALHNQDRWAGGMDMVGTKKPDGSIVLSDKDFGWGDVNSGIGRQWEQGGRVESMDIEACEAQRNGLGQEKMNVELRACGKKEAKKNGCH